MPTSPSASQSDNSNFSRLAFFPISLFGSIMGLSGITLVTQKIVELFATGEIVFYGLIVLTSVAFIAISLTYILKFIRHPSSVKNELSHPVAVHFFPTFSISLLLLALIYQDIAFSLAQSLWLIGALFQFGFLLYILNNWIYQENWQISHMNPAWFIPVVGNIVVPIGAVKFANLEVAWFFFSIGLIFWLILNSIVMYRLFFHAPMLKLLEPTLFILIAPPAVGFISYMHLQGMDSVDEFARILYYIALFLTLFLLSQSLRFIKVPFSLSWWAYTFPVAAISLASFIMYQQLQLSVFALIGSVLMSILGLLVFHLSAKTLWMIKAKKLCVPPA